MEDNRKETEISIDVVYRFMLTLCSGNEQKKRNLKHIIMTRRKRRETVVRLFFFNDGVLWSSCYHICLKMCMDALSGVPGVVGL